MREFMGLARELPPEKTPPTAYGDAWVAYGKAVMHTHGMPPLLEDGEVRCANEKCVLPSGAKPFLNRTDTRCYWCGGDELLLVGAELQKWYRVPKPEPKAEPKAEPPAQAVATALTINGQPIYAWQGGLYTYAPAPGISRAASLACRGQHGAQCALCAAYMQARAMQGQQTAPSHSGATRSQCPACNPYLKAELERLDKLNKTNVRAGLTVNMVMGALVSYLLMFISARMVGR